MIRRLATAAGVTVVALGVTVAPASAESSDNVSLKIEKKVEGTAPSGDSTVFGFEVKCGNTTTTLFIGPAAPTPVFIGPAAPTSVFAIESTETSIALVQAEIVATDFEEVFDPCVTSTTDAPTTTTSQVPVTNQSTTPTTTTPTTTTTMDPCNVVAGQAVALAVTPACTVPVTMQATTTTTKKVAVAGATITRQASTSLASTGANLVMLLAASSALVVVGTIITASVRARRK
jgi:hypothetical protein